MKNKKNTPPRNNQLLIRPVFQQPANIQMHFIVVITLPTQTLHYCKEIPQNCHAFVLFDPPQMGNVMTAVTTYHVHQYLGGSSNHIITYPNTPFSPVNIFLYSGLQTICALIRASCCSCVAFHLYSLKKTSSS